METNSSATQPPSPVGSADRSPELLIKVCGMRDSANIREVEAVGIDMMGFIFHPRSPRYVEAVPDYLPTSCLRVGVFVNADIDYILRQVEAFGLGAVQLHGKESPEFCADLRDRLIGRAEDGPPPSRSMRSTRSGGDGRAGDGPPPSRWEGSIIKAVAVGKDVGAYEGVVDMLLFDTPCTEHGGSGRRFDWSLLDGYTGSIPFMLSGGIGPDTASEILSLRHPRLAGIDLNSRFELAPALKDADLLRDFLSTLRSQRYFRNL